VVRQIFDWVGRDRLSIGEVCRRLLRQECPTRSGKRVWDRSTVWAILRNPAYRGAACFGKSLYANKSLTAPGFGRRAGVR
jgi:site-specific DNA recombinase